MAPGHGHGGWRDRAEESGWLSAVGCFSLVAGATGWLGVPIQTVSVGTILVCLTVLASTFILSKVDFSVNTGVTPDHTISVA